MKIALLADTHFGVNKSSPHFARNLSKFLLKKVYPVMRKQGIEHLVHLGDLVDNQVSLTYEDMARIRHDFIQPLEEMHVEAHVLVGNHDRPFKNTNFPNAVEQMLCSMANASLYPRPEEAIIGDLRCAMIPWINRENREDTFELLKTTKARTIFGHLELIGFPLYRGHDADHGDDPSIFKDFDLVVSGHYHERSQSGPIVYLGAPGQYRWSDAGCNRGFGILDTETLEIEYHNNEISMFETFSYGDDVDTEGFRDKYVKVVVEERGDALSYEHFITSLAAISADIKILEKSINEEIGELETPLDSQGLSSLEVMNLYIDSLVDTALDKPLMKKILTNAYHETFSL